MKKLLTTYIISILIFGNTSFIYAENLQLTPKQSFDNKSFGIITSPDGSKTAYGKSNDDKTVSMYENGKKFDNLSFKYIKSIQYSPNSKHLIYFGVSNKTMSSPKSNENGEIMLDSKGKAVIESVDPILTYNLIVDGKDVGEFMNIKNLIFSTYYDDTIYFIGSKLEKDDTGFDSESFMKLYYVWFKGSNSYAKLDDERLNLGKNTDYSSIYGLGSSYAFFSGYNGNEFEEYVSAFAGDDGFRKSRLTFPEMKDNNLSAVLFNDDGIQNGVKDKEIGFVIEDNAESTRYVYKSKLDFAIDSDKWGNKYKDTTLICKEAYNKELKAFMLGNSDIVCVSDSDKKISINGATIATNAIEYAFNNKGGYAFASITTETEKIISDAVANKNIDYSKLETLINMNGSIVKVPGFISSMNFLDNGVLEVFNYGKNGIQQYEISASSFIQVQKQEVVTESKLQTTIISPEQKQKLTADISSRIVLFTPERKQLIKDRVQILLEKFNSRSIKTQTTLKNIELLNIIVEVLNK